MTKPEIPKHEGMTNVEARMPQKTLQRRFRHSELGILSCLGISCFYVVQSPAGGFSPASRAMCDVTRILGQIESGDPHAAQELLPLVYNELRQLAAAKMAQERPDQTLQATALVHEAYIRLVDQSAGEHWENRRHFFAAAAEAMRRILVDHARQRLATKRGRGIRRQTLDANLIGTASPEEILAVHDALDALAQEDAMAADVVRLRYFGGFSIEEAATILGVSRATAYRLWTFAHAWLWASLADDDR